MYVERKKLKKNLCNQLLTFLSLITLRVRKWEKNVGYELLHAGEEKQENKHPIKQCYCCISPFSASDLQLTPHQPSAFIPNRMLSPLTAFLFFPLVQWPVVTILKLWSNRPVKQNQSLYSQKSLFYIAEWTGTNTNLSKQGTKKKIL